MKSKDLKFITLFILLFLFVVEGIFVWMESPEQSARYQEMKNLTILVDEEKYQEIFDSHPERFWQLKPNVTMNGVFFKGTISNKFRFRNPEMSLEKEPGIYRILALGDSTTFCTGVEMQESWPYLLAEDLKHHLVNVEVVNAGVPGYTSYQGLKYLKELMDSLDPDLVLVNFGNNDGWSWGQKTDKEMALSFGMMDFLQKSAFVRFFTLHVQRNQPLNDEWRRQVIDHETKRRLVKAKWKPRVSLKEYKENLDSFHALAQQHNAQIFYMILPWQEQVLDEGWSQQEYHEIVKNMTEQHQGRVIDFLPVFVDSEYNSELFIDEIHASLIGNAIIAEKLKEVILQDF